MSSPCSLSTKPTGTRESRTPSTPSTARFSPGAVSERLWLLSSSATRMGTSRHGCKHPHRTPLFLRKVQEQSVLTLFCFRFGYQLRRRHLHVWRAGDASCLHDAPSPPGRYVLHVETFQEAGKRSVFDRHISSWMPIAVLFFHLTTNTIPY